MQLDRLPVPQRLCDESRAKPAQNGLADAHDDEPERACDPQDVCKFIRARDARNQADDPEHRAKPGSRAGPEEDRADDDGNQRQRDRNRPDADAALPTVCRTTTSAASKASEVRRTTDAWFLRFISTSCCHSGYSGCNANLFDSTTQLQRTACLHIFRPCFTKSRKSTKDFLRLLFAWQKNPLAQSVH